MNLTDRQFWEDYWKSKSGLIFQVEDKFVLNDILRGIMNKNSISTALEIGGFPGHYSVYLAGKFGIKATVLDFVIVPELIRELIKVNHAEIDWIETDLFTFHTDKRFDLVFSNGLIEHFEDTREIILKHTELVSKGGSFFVSLPNFRGFNGWLQKAFDPENYAKHYIGCMDPDFLKSVCEDLGMKNVSARYHGVFMIWLENLKSKGLIFRLLFKITWFIFKVFFKIFPVNTRTFSPYIVVTATK